MHEWLKTTDFFAGDCWVFAKICFFGQGFWKCYALFSILFPVSLSYSVSQIKKRVPSCLDKNQQYFLLMTCSQEAKQIFSKKIHPILRFLKTMEHKNWTKKMFQCWNRWLISSLLAPSNRFVRFFHLHGIFLSKWASFVFDYVHLDTAAFVICSFMNEVHRKKRLYCQISHSSETHNTVRRLKCTDVKEILLVLILLLFYRYHEPLHQQSKRRGGCFFLLKTDFRKRTEQILFHIKVTVILKERVFQC